ncbi:MAG: hypothetical protein KatS3mg050_2479 [Litorilinea sp.]|nr:MAG: hypothetical protein KatS3mg050_2479 [Litorilinea sp.]
MRRPATIALCVLLLFVSLYQLAGLPVTRSQAPGPDYVPGELIIRFQPGVTQAEAEAFYQEHGLVQKDNLDEDRTDDAVELRLAAVPGDITQELLAQLARDPRVVYAEPNYIIRLSKTPDDPMFSQLWGLHNTGQTGGTPDADIDAPEAWDTSTGSSTVIVGVIDTGVDYNHEDLAQNMWTNPKECPQGPGKCVANGEDDDDNGYVDDFYGINAITDTGDPMDDYGHGTHVAGTIGALGNNGTGVTGINWTVRIAACKFLSASGSGSVAGAVKCFNYFKQLKNQAGQNIIATNNSWGGGGFSQALYDAMAGADQPLHICAAGNGNSGEPHYPAGFDLDNIISVAATDHDDLYANFSNYGKDWVDLAAPGVGILSTVPTGSCPMCDPSGYGQASGTSMATPHVTGAVALIAGKYSNLTLAQIKQRILAGVDPLTDTSKETLTNGRLNLNNALEDDNKPPAAVSDLAVTATMLTQVELSWTATGDDDKTGTANAYDVRYATSPISEDTWESATQAVGEPKPQPAGSSEKFIVSGLEPNTTYYFALKVVDNVGNASALSNVVVGKTSTGTVVFEDDVESGPGEWEVAGNDSLWHISQHRSNSPTHAWYYGDESKRNYDTGGANNGTLTSPAIELTTNQDVLLTFYEWSEVESSQAYDRTRVQISTDGNQWTTVFESHGTNGSWIRRAVSLTPHIGNAKTLYVRFWFDTIDNRFNTFEGWYVDDIRVLVATPTQAGAGPAQPNLVMQESNIGFSNSNPTEGEEVTVYATVLNHGTAEANDVTVQFVDVTGEQPTPIGLPQTIANIPVGGSAIAQIRYDTTGKSGERQIQVVLDPNNLIAELNEFDNQAQKSLTVAAQPAPNLVIEDDNIGFAPAQPGVGEQVTIHAVIFNNGTAEASDVAVQFLDVTATDQAIPIGPTQTIDILRPGESHALEVTYDTSNKPDDREIRVVVDPHNTIAESNEKDNEATKTLSMGEPPAPNLTVSSTNIGFAPAQPKTGDLVTISATIFNAGDVAATDVQVEFADATGSTAVPIGPAQTIAAIPPGASGVVQVTYDTSGKSGDRRIQVTVDPHNFIAESREFDNEARATLSITPPPLPNLTVHGANIGFSPAQPVEGDVVTIRVPVLNTGAADASQVVVQFLEVRPNGPVPIGERQTLEAIPAGGSAEAQVTFDTSQAQGDHTIQVVVDPNNFIPESNEDDNQASRTLRVVAPDAPNLTMLAANIQFNPPQPMAGDLVTITAVVLNSGAADASRVLVQFLDITHSEAIPITPEQYIERVPAGGSATVSAQYDTTDKVGRRKIQLLVDSNNLIPETDENDNEAVATLTVEPAPLANLVVSDNSIGFDPPMPVAGDTVTVTITVHNHGNAAAQDVAVQLLDITEGEAVPVGPPLTIDQIPAGGAGTVQTRYETAGRALGASGERQLRVVVDPNNFIPETDETDNRTTRTLTVTPAQAPNLVVLANNVGFHPANPSEGQAVTLTVTVLNTGAMDAEDVLIQFVDATNGGAEPIGAKQTIARIPAGQSGTAQVVYETTGKAGDRRIRVVADPHATIAETDERDNEAVKVLRVLPPAMPNLVMRAENIGFKPVDPTTGQAVTVTATVLNVGAAPAQNVVVQFVDATNNGTTPIGASQIIAEIPAGGSGRAQIVYDTGRMGAAGDRKIQVIVDPNNQIVESDENDNRAVATLKVAALPAPNLVIRSDQIGFEPPRPNAGDTVQIYATVRNSGGQAANDVTVQFLDVTGSGAVPIGSPQTVATILPGSSALFQTSYELANGGNRKIQVVVDPNNTVAESNEGDNSATATLNLAELPEANLAVLADNILFTPASPIVGDQVTVHAIILNNGAADVSDVVVQFSDVTGSDPQPIGPPQVIPAIPAGSSATAQVLYDTASRGQGAPGERTIQVTVDPNNLIPESRESDNSAKKSFTVTAAPRPNLVVLAGNVGFNPPAPTTGDRVTVQAVVLNHGAVEARDVVVQLADITDSGPGSGVPIGPPQTIARIAPGSSGAVQFTYDTSGKEGSRTLQVTADPNNFILESDENDNRATRDLTVAPRPTPNLVAIASNIEFEPAEPSDGDLVTIRATVLNNGTAPASDVVVRLVDITNGQEELIDKQRLIESIPAGESGVAQVTYDVTDKAGTRQIQLVVDPNDTIAESDETDNTATTSLTVAPPPAPNLVVQSSDIRFTPSSPSAGDLVTVTVTVRNTGQRNANNVEVRFTDVTNGGNTPIGTQTIASIPSGGSGIAQVAYDTTGKEGQRQIQVTADPNNTIAETNEEDNQAQATLTVAPPSETPSPNQPNLQVTAEGISFDPPAPSPGDLVTITVIVTNSGQASASGVVVRFLDVTGGSEEPIGEDQNVGNIAAGNTTTATVTYDTTDKAGERSIKVIVDPEDTISESDETDNEATKTLTVGEGSGEEAQATPAHLNLTVRREQMVVEPLSAGANDTLMVAVLIHNEGDVDAYGVPVQFREVVDGTVKPIGEVQTLDVLPAGGSQMVRALYPVDGRKGECAIQVVVDPEGSLVESDRSDNLAEVLVRLSPQP